MFPVGQTNRRALRLKVQFAAQHTMVEAEGKKSLGRFPFNQTNRIALRLQAQTATVAPSGARRNPTYAPRPAGSILAALLAGEKKPSTGRFFRMLWWRRRESNPRPSYDSICNVAAFSNLVAILSQLTRLLGYEPVRDNANT